MIVAWLTFLKDYSMVGYYLLGLVALWYVFRFCVALFRSAKSKFELERKLASAQRNGSIVKFGLAVCAIAALHLSVEYALPEAQRIERIREAADAANLPTITPTPTPLLLFDVDVSGCNNPQARLLQPRPGDAVKGKVTILIVADIPNFAFYKIELYRSDEPDVRVPLFNDDQVATEEEPYAWVWDSSTVVPGVYHLQLTVMDGELKYPPPCVVPIQVLAKEP